MPAASGRRVTGFPTALAALAVIYLAGIGAVHFAPDHGPVAAWWPAAGIAVALIALAPRRAWPLLAVGVAVFSAAANRTGGRPLDISLGFGVANAAEAVAAGLFLKQRRDRPPALRTQDDFIRLVEAAILGGLVVATGASLVVVAFTADPFLGSWLSVLPSHAASTLVIVPVALSWRQAFDVRRPWEVAAQVLALTVATLLTFAPGQHLALSFVPLPFLVWAALRLGVRIVAWELLGLSVMCTFLSARGDGPFGSASSFAYLDPASTAAVVQGYLLSAALMSLPLAVAVEQRRSLLAEVTSREELFRRNFTESLVGMLLIRFDGSRLQIVDVNETAVRVTGGERATLLGRFLDLVLDTPVSLDNTAAQMLAGRLDGWTARTGLRDRPGARVNVALSLLSAGPEPMFSAQLQDVTAEHDARRRLEAAEKLTSATLDTTACIILVTDLDGTIVRVNAATTTLTGFAEDELLGRPVWETEIAPTRAGDVQALFVWPNRPGGPVTREADARTRHGETLRVVWNTNIVRDERGRPMYAVMTGIDVTAERTAAGLMSHLLQAAMSTALIGIDTRGRITVFNSGAQNLLGYDEHEMVGRPFVDLLEPHQLVARTGCPTPGIAFGSLVDGISADGGTRSKDWTWVAKGGRRHTVSMTLSVAADAFAAQIGFLCVGRDVTEQRHSQEMLVAALDKERTAVERLRLLDAAKNDFVSTVSHELRTPVTSIVGYTEMLRDGSVVDPDPGQLPLLDTIARNGERLITLCNDLLQLSGLDSGAVTWERESVDLVAVVDHVEESTRPLLNGRRLAVSFDRPDQPVLVLGDRAQLERVLLNLLSNAVKFTEDGGEIECRLEARDDEARLVVRDTGIGIPDEEQAGLFQKFFRSSTAQDRAIQGTGLGLSIVAGIVAAHGGRVGVESAHLAGTTFTVRLPLMRVRRG